MKNRGNIAIVVAFVLLAAVAVAGWVRTPGTAKAAGDTEAALTPANLDSNCGATLTPALYQSQPAIRTQRLTSQPAYRPVQRTYVARRQPRPLSHSVAIVAGGAGVGAAIGGIAGGGKGAGIGALSGGAAGFIYDRLTHNR